MATRKYRLAAPESNRLVPTLAPRLPRLIMSNDAKLSSRRVLLNNVKTVEKVPFNPPARWWLVLPCVLLIMLAGASDPLLMNDLIVRRYERYYGLDSSAGAQRASCRESITIPVSNVEARYWQYWQLPPLYANPPRYRADYNFVQRDADYNLVQRDAARFNVKNSFATVIPATLTFILLGSNSDIIGRRPLLVLPFLDTWLIATNALEATFGFEGLVLLSALAYITDCTNESRTRAFLLTELLIVIGRIIPVLGVSLWLRNHLYTVPLSVDLALSVIGLFYALFIQPESVKSVQNISLIRQLMRIRLKPIIRIIMVFAAKRSGNKRQSIILITIVTILVLFILFGFSSVFALYLYGQPFCFGSFNVGLVSLAQASTVLIMSSLLILCKKTLNDTYILPILGSLSLSVGLILFSIAKKIWLLYIAACIGSLFFITLPVLRTKLTNLVEVNEYAIVFIAAGFVETIGHQALGAVANAIYNASLQFFPGLVFLVFGVTGVFPLSIMIYLVCSESRKSRNTTKRTVANSRTKAHRKSKYSSVALQL